jgi:hypothetical protein
LHAGIARGNAIVILETTLTIDTLGHKSLGRVLFPVAGPPGDADRSAGARHHGSGLTPATLQLNSAYGDWPRSAPLAILD